MDAGFDTGPILAQWTAPEPVGGRAQDLERALMAQGGRLVAETLPKLAGGAITPRPQDDRLATTAPLPTAADFELAANWPAEHAFTFAYGVAPRNGPLTVKLAGTGERIRVQDALDFSPGEPMARAVADEGRGVVRVRFDPGWARFLRADAARYPLSLSPSSAREKR
jgi:methionyl-tRNA formyltransferase